MHEFWNKQPVPSDHGLMIGEIDTTRVYDPNPVTLPDGYTWSDCSIQEITSFLSEHYIRDEHFAFNYTEPFIEWATESEWNLGVRSYEDGSLVGFISGVPSKYRVHTKVLRVLQINFLCVHEKLRNKKFAPLLISEIRRRANACGTWQAVYTAVTELPTPVAKTQYWHRLINVRKLNRAKFSNERENSHVVKGWTNYAVMCKSDVPIVTKTLKKHLEKYSIAPVIDEAWVRRWLLPKEGVVYTYFDEDTGHVTSHYCVPYTSVKTGIVVKQAYMFYNTSDTFEDGIILAKNYGFDVYNTLDIGLDTDMLRASKFMVGSGHNHCYVYNWSCGMVSRENIFMRFF